jgi:IS605 OrfB family transposase
MIRSSEHILKFQTDSKTVWLDKLFSDYKQDLQSYIDLIWNKELPLEKIISSKKLPCLILKHSQYKQILYKQASEIIRSNIEKKKTSKPEIKNISINIDERLFDIKTDNKTFDEFIHLRLPYIIKHRALFIRLPVKYHKHSLKFKDWKRANTIKLKQVNGHYFVIFTYEKEDLIKRTIGRSTGIDQGYNKLIATSDHIFVGTDEMTNIYEKISRKKQGSVAFKKALEERDNKINELINSMDLSQVREIVIENLKSVKSGSKNRLKKKLKDNKISYIQFLRYKKFTNKLQRWCYSKVVSKLDSFCEENGILLTKVNPSYTSQTCSKCGSIHKENRSQEVFKCIECGYETDADYNASVNILHRGVYNLSTTNDTRVNTFVNYSVL